MKVPPAAPGVGNRPVATVPSTVEKPSPQEPAKGPRKPDAELDAEPDAAPDAAPDASAVDRWQDAFKGLSEDKQKTHTEMGFHKPKTANVKSIITDLVNNVNERQTECEKKFWRVKIGGKDIVLREYTTSILSWLEKAGDIAVQFAPPQASLPWDVVKSLMQVSIDMLARMKSEAHGVTDPRERRRPDVCSASNDRESGPH